MRTIPKGDLVFDISEFEKARGSISPLAPNPALLEDWNSDRIRWKEYVERYLLQLYRDKMAGSLLDEIISLSMERDVWLVGLEEDYPCPRFLVKQIIEKVLYERKVVVTMKDYAEQYHKFKNMTKSQTIKMKKSSLSCSGPTSRLPG
jgi:hypothetical protein